jgi:hypothetical protein
MESPIIEERKSNPFSWQNLENVMARVGEDEMLRGNKDAIIGHLSEEVRLNLVADSFRFSIGSQEAQALYGIYCARLMGFKKFDEDTGFEDREGIEKLFTDLYKSLSLESRKKIAAMAPKSHENLESNMDDVGSADLMSDPMCFQLENNEYYIGDKLAPSLGIVNAVDYILGQRNEDKLESRPSLYAVAAYLGAFGLKGGKAHLALPKEKQDEVYQRGKELFERAMGDNMTPHPKV